MLRIGFLPRVSVKVLSVGAPEVARRLLVTGAPERPTAPTQRRRTDAEQEQGRHLAFDGPPRCECGRPRRGCLKRGINTSLARAYVTARVAMSLARTLRCPCFEVEMIKRIHTLPAALHWDVLKIFWKWVTQEACQGRRAVWHPLVFACLRLFGTPRSVACQATLALTCLPTLRHTMNTIL